MSDWAAAFSIISLPITVLLYWLGNRPPRLAIWTSGEPLFSLNETPYLLYLRLALRGRRPLRTDDFAEPLVMELPRSVDVYEVKSATGTKPYFAADGVKTRIAFAPQVINPRDDLRLTYLLSDRVWLPDEAQGRIAGVRRVEVKSLEAKTLLGPSWLVQAFVTWLAVSIGWQILSIWLRSATP